MRQVLWNLVRNAVQASGAGQRVRVVVRAGGGGVDLSVDDQGPGIPDSARAKIFDAFYTTRAGGAGIGLAVVKRIIDDHAAAGATIAVESSVEGGATFCIHLDESDRDRATELRPERGLSRRISLRLRYVFARERGRGMKRPPGGLNPMGVT